MDCVVLNDGMSGSQCWTVWLRMRGILNSKMLPAIMARKASASIELCINIDADPRFEINSDAVFLIVIFATKRLVDCLDNSILKNHLIDGSSMAL